MTNENVELESTNCPNMYHSALENLLWAARRLSENKPVRNLDEIFSFAASTLNNQVRPVAPSAPQSTQTAREFLNPWLDREYSGWLVRGHGRMTDDMVMEFAESYASSRVASLQQELDAWKKGNKAIGDELDRTAEELANAEAKLAKCGKENCMGRTVEGVRSWVSKESKEAVDAKLSTLTGELDRFKALDQHLPPGYAIGDDATAELAVELVEANEQIRTLTGIARELAEAARPYRLAIKIQVALEKFSDWEKTQAISSQLSASSPKVPE